MLCEGKIERLLPFQTGRSLIHSPAIAAERKPITRVTAFTDRLLGEAGRQERAAEATPRPVSVGD